MFHPSESMICYGVMFPSGFDFPWTAAPYNGDHGRWWSYEICGYVPSVEVYTEKGILLDGVARGSDEFRCYNDALLRYQAAHPAMITPVKGGSYSSPMAIIALSNTIIAISGEDPHAFFSNQIDILYVDVMELMSFCSKYCNGRFSCTIADWYLVGPEKG